MVVGQNTFGQLGNGTTISEFVPTQVGTETNWLKVKINKLSVIALKTNGTLWSWGLEMSHIGNSGSLNGYFTVPTQIGSDTDWVKFSIGDRHTLALKNNGTLWSWGVNTNYRLGNSLDTSFETYLPTQVGTENNWSMVSAGYSQSMAIKTDGTLWAWGYRLNGQLGLGYSSTLIDTETPTQVGINSNWATVVAGKENTLAIKSDGSLWGCGRNFFGELGNNSNIESQVPIQIGNENNWNKISTLTHSLAISTTGSLFAWSRNDNGQLGTGTITADALLVPTSIACPVSLANETFNTYIFTVHPNPVRDILTVNGSEIQSAKVYNMLGQEIMSKTFNNNNNQIDMSSLAKSNYLVKIQSATATQILKVVKE